jgi:UDP-N-acetylglucosamine-lysosomal-enzyme
VDWPGDGWCDAECNFAACGFDGGDCGGGVDPGSGECAPGCPEGWPGDGWCDFECDVEACGFDGGDCGF